MKITYNKLLQIKKPLEKLCNCEIAIKSRVKILKLMKTYNEEMQIFSQIANELITKYSDKDKIIIKEKTQELQAKYNDLLNVEINFDIQKINLDEFGDVKMSAAELYVLSDVVENLYGEE